ncbi:MAG: hypothetical protein RR326_14285, partial [Stenotrophomonas sp.]
MGIGATVGTATLWVHNGLDRKVVSQVGSKTITLAPGATQSMGVDLDKPLRLGARTVEGQQIESFYETPEFISGPYIYNIPHASPFVEWSAGYR